MSEVKDVHKSKQEEELRLIDKVELGLQVWFLGSFFVVFFAELIDYKTGIINSILGQYSDLAFGTLMLTWVVCVCGFGIIHNTRRQNGEIDGRTIRK